jgi:hypothetical protein
MESAELLRRIRDELLRKVELPTAEWKTSRQWMEEWGLHQSQTNRLLQQAVEAGIMEAKPFRVPCSTRASYPIPHYREIKARC